MIDSEQRAREDFERVTAEHEMTVLRDDGLYRHLRFQRPGSSFYYYDLVTWPGHLVICGDVDAYHFARTADMFEFFASSGGRINPHYWGEKLQGREAGRTGAQSYSEDAYRAAVLDWYAEQAREILDLGWDAPVDTSAGWLARSWLELPYPDPRRLGLVRAAASYQIEIPPESEYRTVEELEARLEMLEEAIALRDAVEDQLLQRDAWSSEQAHRLLEEFEHDGRRLRDSWEWDLREYDQPFLWSCWAIVTGIARYRAVQPQAKAAA